MPDEGQPGKATPDVGSIHKEGEERLQRKGWSGDGPRSQSRWWRRTRQI
jgi:hypothetical protein